MKTAFDGEWVSISPNGISKKWNVWGECKKCKRASCAPHWYSIKSKKLYCKKCFTPKVLRRANAD